MQQTNGRHRRKIIIFFGPPGSGKGTQAALLSGALGIPAISTGEMLRRECCSGSPLGRSLKAILAAGQLVNDDLMNEAVARRLSQPDCHDGAILDGYPRTLAQARYLEGLLGKLGMPLPKVIHLEVTADEILARLARRLECPKCGKIFVEDSSSGSRRVRCDRDGSRVVRRSDDNAASVAQRLQVYEVSSAEVVKFYDGPGYHRVAGNRSPEEISEDILDRLQERFRTPATHHQPVGPTVAAFSAR
jgi:adenylate kinase